MEGEVQRLEGTDDASAVVVDHCVGGASAGGTYSSWFCKWIELSRQQLHGACWARLIPNHQPRAAKTPGLKMRIYEIAYLLKSRSDFSET